MAGESSSAADGVRAWQALASTSSDGGQEASSDTHWKPSPDAGRDGPFSPSPSTSSSSSSSHDRTEGIAGPGRRKHGEDNEIPKKERLRKGKWTVSRMTSGLCVCRNSRNGVRSAFRIPRRIASHSFKIFFHFSRWSRIIDRGRRVYITNNPVLQHGVTHRTGWSDLAFVSGGEARVRSDEDNEKVHRSLLSGSTSVPPARSSSSVAGRGRDGTA